MKIIVSIKPVFLYTFCFSILHNLNCSQLKDIDNDQEIYSVVILTSEIQLSFHEVTQPDIYIFTLTYAIQLSIMLSIHFLL